MQKSLTVIALVVFGVNAKGRLSAGIFSEAESPTAHLVRERVRPLTVVDDHLVDMKAPQLREGKAAVQLITEQSLKSYEKLASQDRLTLGKGVGEEDNTQRTQDEAVEAAIYKTAKKADDELKKHYEQGNALLDDLWEKETANLKEREQQIQDEIIATNMYANQMWDAIKSVHGKEGERFSEAKKAASILAVHIRTMFQSSHHDSQGHCCCTKAVNNVSCAWMTGSPCFMSTSYPMEHYEILKQDPTTGIATNFDGSELTLINDRAWKCAEKNPDLLVMGNYNTHVAHLKNSYEHVAVGLVTHRTTDPKDLHDDTTLSSGFIIPKKIPGFDELNKGSGISPFDAAAASPLDKMPHADIVSQAQAAKAKLPSYLNVVDPSSIGAIHTSVSPTRTAPQTVPFVASELVAESQDNSEGDLSFDDERDFSSLAASAAVTDED